MRNSRIDTIAQHRDEFLAGKSEAYVKKFNEKNINQQYAAIAHWKRQAKALGEATGEVAKVGLNTVLVHLKNAHKQLVKLAELSPKQVAKIQGVLDSVKTTIDNFDMVKKQQLLASLQKEQENLAKKKEDLAKQIETLQQELG